jgi:uncharacterized protein YndB with AHSA1/START domain
MNKSPKKTVRLASNDGVLVSEREERPDERQLEGTPADEIESGDAQREVRRFERRLAHPPEKVWRALTESGELSHWFPADIHGAPEEGAPLRFVFRDGEEPNAEGTVTECDPPRVLSYTMGDETLRWELFPTKEGCVLVLTTETARTERGSAGFRACTTRLAA